jgi:hypothetical protein
MNCTFVVAALSMAVVSCTVLPAKSYAQVNANIIHIRETPNIIVMGEDTNKNSIPRNSRVHRRAMNAISDQLSKLNLNVFNEVVVSLENFMQGRTRRTDAELIDVARSINQPPIDLAVLFTIYADIDRQSYTTRISSRIEGRVLNVRSGKRIGGIDFGFPRVDKIATSCDGDCLLEAVGKQVQVLALDSGYGLAKIIERDIRKGFEPGVTIKFKNFSRKEVTEIEEFISAFSGYRSKRPMTTTFRHVEYWYVTTSKVDRLNRNLRMMLEHMGIEARIAFGGWEFEIEKL